MAPILDAASASVVRPESVAALAAVILLLGLALFVFLKHEDGRASLAAVLVSLLVVLSWALGSSRQRELAGELDGARDRIAALEDRPKEREFEPKARELMVRRLRDFVGPTAFVVANASDPETVEYARQIVAILKEAGWEVPPSFGMTYQPIVLPGHAGAMPGVVLGVSASVPGDFAAAILNVLREGGIDIVAGPHWPGTEHPISILVGPKRES
jgi:hypothetical protein